MTTPTDAEHIPHTCGGFSGAFYAEHKRMPSAQEIWDAAIRSYRDLKRHPQAGAGGDPVAFWSEKDGLLWSTGFERPERCDFYTAQPPQAVREPGVSEVRWAMCTETGHECSTCPTADIPCEAAHGITKGGQHGAE